MEALWRIPDRPRGGLGHLEEARATARESCWTCEIWNRQHCRSRINLYEAWARGMPYRACAPCSVQTQRFEVGRPVSAGHGWGRTLYACYVLRSS